VLAEEVEHALLAAGVDLNGGADGAVEVADGTVTGWQREGGEECLRLSVKTACSEGGKYGVSEDFDGARSPQDAGDDEEAEQPLLGAPGDKARAERTGRAL
jgi:hypothetical protein